MNRCKNCEVDIVDDAIMCPLCHSVLERDEDKNQIPNMYPDVQHDKKLLKTIGQIYIIFAIVCQIVLSVVNVYTNDFNWSAICAGVFIYLYLTIKFSIDNADAGYSMKILVQAIGLMGLLILIDHLIGYTGWSITYAMPCVVIAIDIIIVFFMIIHWSHWQSYLLLQLFMVLVGIVLLGLCAFNIIDRPLMTIIAASVSAGSFVVTFILGDKKAKDELKRKFYV